MLLSSISLIHIHSTITYNNERTTSTKYNLRKMHVLGLIFPNRQKYTECETCSNLCTNLYRFHILYNSCCCTHCVIQDCVAKSAL